MLPPSDQARALDPSGFDACQEGDVARARLSRCAACVARGGLRRNAEVHARRAADAGIAAQRRRLGYRSGWRLAQAPRQKKQPHDFRRRSKVRARAGGLEFARQWYDSDSHTGPAKSNRMVAVLRRRGAATAAPMALRAQRTQAGAVGVVVGSNPKKKPALARAREGAEDAHRLETMRRVDQLPTGP
jgi:hypothetical protein